MEDIIHNSDASKNEDITISTLIDPATLDRARWIPTEKGMLKIALKEGSVIIPDREDWKILFNYSRPQDCMYAGVVEVRDPIKGNRHYAANHFVFFSDYKYGRNYPKSLYEDIYKACIEKDPSFKKIVDAENAVDKEGNRIPRIYKPCIGLFHIDDMEYLNWMQEEEPLYRPPYGAIILR